jgi:hypothetical protein
LTRTTKRRPSRSERRGVITSSSPACVHVATRPLTETDMIPPPAKSRLNRDSDCVARAITVTVPSTASVGLAVS